MPHCCWSAGCSVPHCCCCCCCCWGCLTPPLTRQLSEMTSQQQLRKQMQTMRWSGCWRKCWWSECGCPSPVRKTKGHDKDCEVVSDGPLEGQTAIRQLQHGTIGDLVERIA